MYGADLGNGVALPQVHVDAIQQLLNIKGVTRVGLGLKHDPVQHALPQWAYRVYMAWQRGTDWHTAVTNIQGLMKNVPAQIGSVPIDLFYDITSFTASSRPSLRPGARITPYSADAPLPEGYGSIGLMVNRGGTRYLLTAAHVLDQTDQWHDPVQSAVDLDHYSPDKASICSSMVVARSSAKDAKTMLNGIVDTSGVPATWAGSTPTASELTVRFRVDVGLAKIDDAITNTSNYLSSLPATLAFHDLTPMVMQPTPTVVAVWKQGARTGQSKGVVVELLSAVNFNGTGYVLWALQIDATDATKVDETLTTTAIEDMARAPALPDMMLNRAFTITDLTPPATPPPPDTRTSVTLRWQGMPFGRHGDSGSAVFDSNGNVVALLTGVDTYMFMGPVGIENDWGGGTVIEVGPTHASYITQTFAALGLDASAMMSASQQSAGTIVTPVLQPARLREVARALDRSEAGRSVHALVVRHADEIASLVHHRRRVTIAYHRSKASAYAALLLGSLANFDAALPAHIDGITPRKALAALLTALHAEASTLLRTDLDQHAAWLCDLVDDATSIEAIFTRLDTASCANTLHGLHATSYT
jgi:hypothetical protein